MDCDPQNEECGGLPRALTDYVDSRESLLRKLAWNLDRCVAEMLSRSLSAEQVAYAVIDYANTSIALQRRVRADYINAMRYRRDGIFLPYIHQSGAGGATTREQIYSRVAFQAALGDLAEYNTRGGVRENRWEGGHIQITSEPPVDAGDISEVRPEQTSELTAAWVPVFLRDGTDRREWRGLGALKRNLQDWQQLVFDLAPFLT